MDNMQIYSNPDFGEIRTLARDGEPWFVGADVAKALGYGNSRQALVNHVDDDDKAIFQKSRNVTFNVPPRGLTIINESGLYSLIFSSQLPAAKKFKRWVTREVLPSIRKTGRYAMAAEPQVPPKEEGNEQYLSLLCSAVAAYRTVLTDMTDISGLLETIARNNCKGLEAIGAADMLRRRCHSFPQKAEKLYGEIVDAEGFLAAWNKMVKGRDLIGKENG